MPQDQQLRDDLGITPLDVAAFIEADQLNDEQVTLLLDLLYQNEQEFLLDIWRGDEVRDEFAAELAEERLFLAELGPVDPLHPLLPKDQGEQPQPADFDIYFKFAYLRPLVKRMAKIKDTMSELLHAYGYNDRDDALMERMATSITHFHLTCLTSGVLPTPIGSIGLKQTMVIQPRSSSAPWFEGLLRRFQGHPVSGATGEAQGAAFLDRLHSRHGR